MQWPLYTAGHIFHFGDYADTGQLLVVCVLRGQRELDGLHLGARLLQRHAGGEAADDADLVPSALPGGGVFALLLNRRGDEDLDVGGVGEGKAGGHDADYCVAFIVDGEALAECFRGVPVERGREIMAEDDGAMAG